MSYPTISFPLLVLQVAIPMATVWLALRRMNPPTSAARTVASTFGVIGRLFGIEHGYYETLQGHILPGTIRIDEVAPPCLPFPFGCEPAMTLVPDFFVTGVLAIIFGLIVMVWAAVFVQRRYGGLTLIVLSLIMLVVGGGFATVTLVIIGGAAGTRIDAPLAWWRAYLPIRPRGLLAMLWPGFFIASMALVPGEFVLGYFFAVGSPRLSLTLGYCQIGLFLLTVLAGFAYDIHRSAGVQQAGG